MNKLNEKEEIVKSSGMEFEEQKLHVQKNQRLKILTIVDRWLRYQYISLV